MIVRVRPVPMASRRRADPIASALVCVLLMTWTCPAAAQLLGPEFQVNSYTTQSQSYPAVAADDAGNFVVVWNSFTQDGYWNGVFGQRFDPSGARVGSEFQVHTFTSGNQKDPAVAAVGQGNFVVTWESGGGWDGSSSGIVGQRYDSSGTRVGSEFQVNTYTGSGQIMPVMAVDGSGNFIVIWSSYHQDGSGFGVFGQRFDALASPIGPEFQVNTSTTYDQYRAKVAADSAGNFVVVWQSYGQYGPPSNGWYGQRFDSAGAKVGSEFDLGNVWGPDVAMDDAGNSVMVWVHSDESGWGVFGQRFDSEGAPVGNEFQVNTETASGQYSPRVAADASGTFVVVWNSDVQDSGTEGVFGQRFDAAGHRVGSEFQVNTYTTGTQWRPAVAASGSGNFVVAWYGRGQYDSWGVAANQATIAIFADGFDLGEACAWSVAVGGGCT